MKRVIVAAVSDTHGGSTKGLLNPNTKLYEEASDGEVYCYKPQLNRVQKYLHWIYDGAIRRAQQIANGDDILLMHLGDLTQGNKYVSELTSTSIYNQIAAGVYNIMPWLEIPNVKSVRLAVGTASHIFLEKTSPMLIRDVLRGKFKEKSIEVVSHGLINIDDFWIDYAHHGPYPGSRKWLEGNVARYYLRDIMMSEIMNGDAPPDLVLRGHYHTYTKETLTISTRKREYESTLFIMPAMCFMNDFSRQVTRSKPRVTNGIVLFELVDGRLFDVHKLVVTADIRTKEIYNV